MPYSSQWVEPELFVSHNGVRVYHVYKNDDVDKGAREFWFTTDELEGEGSDFEFDIRDFAKAEFCGEGVLDAIHCSNREAKRTLIRAAIDAGLLPLCGREVEPEPEGTDRVLDLSDATADADDADDTDDAATTPETTSPERLREEHTTEPWTAESCDRHHSHDSLTCFRLRDAAGRAIEGPANLRRIVACINAMAGVADPAKVVAELDRYKRLSRSQRIKAADDADLPVDADDAIKV